MKKVYNYYCLNKDCKVKDIKLQGPERECPECLEKLKRLGISTSIVHKGTQESRF